MRNREVPILVTNFVIAIIIIIIKKEEKKNVCVRGCLDIESSSGLEEVVLEVKNLRKFVR